VSDIIIQMYQIIRGAQVR